MHLSLRRPAPRDARHRRQPGRPDARDDRRVDRRRRARSADSRCTVSFSTRRIGGPSAGLAFALEIYDSLSGRHLLDGHKIAVTGELDLAGGVHAIGGVKQKTIGAIDAGADTFLVPAGDNLRDARQARSTAASG